ncbi:MAG TPA: dockerin type I domain-containing protein [Candidatus Saccharimonadales bacterium]|nr:dockerin type I domain-containing protein [Candidatus Saccharimonadales bacterium]
MRPKKFLGYCRFIDQNRRLAGLILILTASLFSLHFFGGQVSADYLSNAPTPLAIETRKFKAVCPEVGPGLPHCLSDVVVNSANQVQKGATPATVGGYGPAEIHTAYNLPCTPGGGIQTICSQPASFGPETIVIVDYGSYGGSGTIESNLAAFDQYYGLPDCTVANGCLSIVNQDDQTSPLPAASDTNWALEMNLDVQAVHMTCQTCKIVLMEGDDLGYAINTAAGMGVTAVTNSWGISGSMTSEDAYVEHPGVAILAATGDSGSNEAAGNWPADNPYVVAVAGTSLQINSDDTWASEQVWSGSGGGCAGYYRPPSWQTSLSNWNTAGCGTSRAVGDVSADADPSTGMAVYNGGWEQVGGTSLASPLVAAIWALAGGVPSNTYGPQALYANYGSSLWHDITSGNDCTASVTTHCTAEAGFDTPSGLGSPNGIIGLEPQPLSVPVISAVALDENDVQLSWAASLSTFGVNGYNVYRDNVQIGTTTDTSFDDTGLTANASYNYNVTAYDNITVSDQSSTATVVTYYPEDINGDKHIDLLDLSLLASKYSQSGGSLGRADINRDGRVDLLDLSLLAGRYASE